MHRIFKQYKTINNKKTFGEKRRTSCAPILMTYSTILWRRPQQLVLVA